MTSIFIIQVCQAQNVNINYFNQSPPGDTAQIFAPGIISLANRRETKIVFSPDGRECLIGIGANNTFKMLYSNYYGGYWTDPMPADFITINRPIEPFFSPDSLHIFLTSDANIYQCTRINQTWTTPVILGSPVNTIYEEYHPTVALNGTLYFCSMRENATGFIIYRSVHENGNYSTIEKLADVINRHDSQQDGAYDPFIAPDESYIIFSSIRSGGYGQADQYISYNRNGSWTNPKNLGPSINTNAIEYGSYVSPDGKYYFFSRPVGWGPNAAADIYWVKINDLINSLRNTNFIPYLNTQINNQTDSVGHLFNLTIPDSTFIDDDGNNTLTYSAELTNGNPLPAWLVFDTISATFSGIPTSAELLNIRVTATDPAGADASTTFSIDILKPNLIDLIEGKDIKIFPNPTGGQINISLEALSSKTAIVEIRNLEGETILKNTFKNDIGINLADKPKEIYFVKLIIDNKTIMRKICVE